MANIQPVPRRPDGTERFNAHEWQRWREDVRKTVSDFEETTSGGIVALEARVSQNETDITQNQTDIAQNSSDISTLQTQVNDIEDSLSSAANPFELGSSVSYDFSSDITEGYATLNLVINADVVRTVASSFGHVIVKAQYNLSTNVATIYVKVIPDLTGATIYGAVQIISIDLSDGLQKDLGTVYTSKLGAISDTELDNFYVQKSGSSFVFGFSAGYQIGMFETQVTKLK